VSNTSIDNPINEAFLNSLYSSALHRSEAINYFNWRVWCLVTSSTVSFLQRDYSTYSILKVVFVIFKNLRLTATDDMNGERMFLATSMALCN